MKKSALIILTALVTIYGCKPDRLEVDTSEMDLKPLKVLRLEDDLFGIREEGFEKATEFLKKKYGVWYEHYIMSFMDRNGTADSLYKPLMLSFIGDKDVREAYLSVKKMYPANKVNEIAAKLDDCIKRFHHHFPSRTLPGRLITCTNGWNYAFANMDSSLIVGLDMYLGDTSKFYSMLRYPQYQTRRMNEAHLLPDIARGWLLTEFDNSNAGNTLLEHTIFYGKLFYGVEALLPGLHDSLIIGYSEKQLKYCREYERNLWGYFASSNRLFENNMNNVRELTSEGPFTGAISKDCPPRIAMWVGWQIVRSYMKKNESVTLEQLFADQNAQNILNKSKYRP